jgi:hypothetical protein
LRINKKEERDEEGREGRERKKEKAEDHNQPHTHTHFIGFHPSDP